MNKIVSNLRAKTGPQHLFEYNLQNVVKTGEDKTWTRGPWTPTLDRVHGPLSWTGSMDPLSWTGSMDSFFKIMRNEQKQK